jgi:hypothetical protein
MLVKAGGITVDGGKVTDDDVSDITVVEVPLGFSI